MTEAPFATVEETTRVFTKVVTVDTPDGPRAFEIRKQTPNDRQQLREECVEIETGQLDRHAACIMAVHLMVVRPHYSLEEAGKLPEVVWEQLVEEIKQHSNRVSDEALVAPDAEEGAAEAARFPDPDGEPSGAGAMEPVAAGGVDGPPES